MLKRLALFVVTVGMSSFCFADALWHCTATNTKGAVWHWYGQSQLPTRKAVQKLCTEQNDRKSCAMVCFPPQIYFRCLAQDTLPLDITKDPIQAAQHKQGTWYWSSYSKQIAVNGARDACRHNSPYGGCYVNPNQCASS